MNSQRNNSLESENTDSVKFHETNQISAKNMDSNDSKKSPEIESKERNLKNLPNLYIAKLQAPSIRDSDLKHFEFSKFKLERSTEYKHLKF